MNKIKSIYIKNFKAFKDEFDNLNEGGNLVLEGKNFLLYGDNGAGKSSIYEALKVVFFENSTIKKSANEEQKARYKDFWNAYNNQQSREKFEIKINEEDYQTFPKHNYQTFMITMDKFCLNQYISLNELLTNFHLDIEKIENFCKNNYQSIENSVNTKLEEFREKNITISIDEENDFKVKIKDTNRNLERNDNLYQYFNEAKLNLIVLLLLFEAIKKVQQSNRTKLLVLDDFITSLDVANRTFIMQYILEGFPIKEFQIFIFTHNVYFYNLIMFLVKEDEWKFGNLYEIDNEHKIYLKDNVDTVSKIRDFYDKNKHNIDPVGNKIRRRFEVLLHELSKLILVGTVEDSKTILDRVQSNKTIYLKKEKKKYKTASDLVDEICNLLQSTQNLQDIKKTISEYKKNDIILMQKTIEKLKVYQKVTLHPLSHGKVGQTSFTIKELESSLDLLEKLEKNIVSLSKSIDGA
jgi:energy-coupling factor transporter ATP-binding protein EcfA2